PKKPIRVFLCDGRNDNRGIRNGVYDEKWDWFLQNVRMQKALTKKGYDLNFTWGMNNHGQKFGGLAFPEMMRWLWRDAGPVSTASNLWCCGVRQGAAALAVAAWMLLPPHRSCGTMPRTRQHAEALQKEAPILMPGVQRSSSSLLRN